MNSEDIKAEILSTIVADFVMVESADNVHFYATVVAAEFETMTKMQQHKRIMAIFQSPIANEQIHALSLKTYTPEQWKKLKADT